MVIKDNSIIGCDYIAIKHELGEEASLEIVLLYYSLYNKSPGRFISVSHLRQTPFKRNPGCWLYKWSLINDQKSLNC